MTADRRDQPSRSTLSGHELTQAHFAARKESLDDCNHGHSLSRVVEHQGDAKFHRIANRSQKWVMIIIRLAMITFTNMKLVWIATQLGQLSEINNYVSITGSNYKLDWKWGTVDETTSKNPFLEGDADLPFRITCFSGTCEDVCPGSCEGRLWSSYSTTFQATACTIRFDYVNSCILLVVIALAVDGFLHLVLGLHMLYTRYFDPDSTSSIRNLYQRTIFQLGYYLRYPSSLRAYLLDPSTRFYPLVPNAEPPSPYIFILQGLLIDAPFAVASLLWGMVDSNHSLAIYIAVASCGNVAALVFFAYYQQAVLDYNKWFDWIPGLTVQKEPRRTPSDTLLQATSRASTPLLFPCSRENRLGRLPDEGDEDDEEEEEDEEGEERKEASQADVPLPESGRGDEEDNPLLVKLLAKGREENPLDVFSSTKRHPSDEEENRYTLTTFASMPSVDSPINSLVPMACLRAGALLWHNLKLAWLIALLAVLSSPLNAALIVGGDVSGFWSWGDHGGSTSRQSSPFQGGNINHLSDIHVASDWICSFSCDSGCHSALWWNNETTDEDTGDCIVHIRLWGPAFLLCLLAAIAEGAFQIWILLHITYPRVCTNLVLTLGLPVSLLSKSLHQHNVTFPLLGAVRPGLAIPFLVHPSTSIYPVETTLPPISNGIKLARVFLVDGLMLPASLLFAILAGTAKERNEDVRRLVGFGVFMVAYSIGSVIGYGMHSWKRR